jgi:hypothetical protein
LIKAGADGNDPARVIPNALKLVVWNNAVEMMYFLLGFDADRDESPLETAVLIGLKLFGILVAARLR